MPHRALYLNQDYENTSHLCELAGGTVLVLLFLFLFILHNDHSSPNFSPPTSSHYLPSTYLLSLHPTIHSSCLHSERGRPVMVSTKHGTRRVPKRMIGFSWEMEIGKIWLNWGWKMEVWKHKYDWIEWVGEFPGWPQLRLLAIVLAFYQ